MVSARLISRYQKWISDVLINHFSSSAWPAPQQNRYPARLEAEDWVEKIADIMKEQFSLKPKK
jgi:hypothetical protein